MVIHSSLSGASPNCGLPLLLLFLFFSFFLIPFFSSLAQEYVCGNFVIAALWLYLFITHGYKSHCYNKKLLTFDRECLLNREGYSSSLSPVQLHLALTCALLLICLWPSSCGFTALGLLSKRGVDTLCQVILSLRKSAMGYGKIALTRLHLGSDGWLPISIAALMAQGPCLLVLSETCSCPNEELSFILFYLHFYPLIKITWYNKEIRRSLNTQ